MIRRLSFILMIAISAPALADSDELSPVPAHVVLGKPYLGDSAPSKIRFVNARFRPITVTWVSFEGFERTYAHLAPGEEILQPTFVAHRWVVKDALDGTPLQAFISTRSAARDNGAAQIAVVR